MARLYSDLVDGSGRRYFFSLASAPGGVQPATATVRFNGLAPTIFEQVTVFRNPATGTFTFNGRAVSSDVNISPATATITFAGLIAGEQRILTVTNSLPPDYTTPASFPPTVLFINTLSIGRGQISFNYPTINVTQGGNIGFINPSVGQFSFQGLTPTVIFLEVSTGLITFQGLGPSIQTTLIVEPELGSFSFNGNEVGTQRPFQWIDVDQPPVTTWTTTTGVSA